MAQPAVAHPLEPLFEGWQHGLAIVAHPDDLEFGAAAAIARWTGQGKQIVYCLVTSGEAGIDAMAPAQARLVREAEQRAAKCRTEDLGMHCPTEAAMQVPIVRSRIDSSLLDHWHVSPSTPPLDRVAYQGVGQVAG